MSAHHFSNKDNNQKTLWESLFQQACMKIVDSFHWMKQIEFEYFFELPPLAQVKQEIQRNEPQRRMK